MEEMVKSVVLALLTIMVGFGVFALFWSLSEVL